MSGAPAEASAPDWQAVIDGCWPAARAVRAGPWTVRVTRGAGGRVSSISGDAPDRIDEAVAATRAEGQRPSFVVWPRQRALDAALAARGYAVADAVTLWTRPTVGAVRPPHATAFPVWPPWAVMRRLWAEGGIGSERQAVMMRAARGTGLLARANDRPAGVAFAAVHEATAMLSAAYVAPAFRRRGLMGRLLEAALFWSAGEGAATLALVAARDNTAANAAYAAHGMRAEGGYHYRRAPEDEP